MEQLPQINLASISKADVSKLADDIKALLIEGVVNPLEFLVRKKALEAALEAVVKDPVVDVVITNELAKWPKDKANVHGAEVSLGSRTTYNYGENEEYAKLQTGVKELEARIKAASQTGADLIDPDTGAVLASPVSTKTSSFLTVKFAK